MRSAAGSSSRRMRLSCCNSIRPRRSAQRQGTLAINALHLTTARAQTGGAVAGEPRTLASGESMDLDTLWAVADRARERPRLIPEDVNFIRDVAPDQLESFPRLQLPTRIRHPAGFSISGASV